MKYLGAFVASAIVLCASPATASGLRIEAVQTTTSTPDPTSPSAEPGCARVQFATLGLNPANVYGFTFAVQRKDNNHLWTTLEFAPTGNQNFRTVARWNDTYVEACLGAPPFYGQPAKFVIFSTD